MTKILLIDDDEKIKRMLTRRLKKAGYEIHTAENGKIGVEKVLALQPNLTLMDMHMPVMNGYEAASALRETGYTGLVIALTASAMAEDVHKSITAGCNYFLSKPIEVDFEQKILAILEGNYE
ncbi:MAG: response regulator [Candidatus Parabeggiatoa sp.]|nr:response regulator [Candidatus Parabeggiatoa sp.]